MDILFIVGGVVLFFVVLLFAYEFMKNKKKSNEDKEKYVPTTQDIIPVEYVRSNVMKLKNGGYRVAIEIPSVNIELMEVDEQDIVLSQYRQILNGIEFPFQILQQSRTVDITDYRKLLDQKEAETPNRLNKRLISEFNGFLAQLINERTILTKRFYVIIPYDEEREVKTVYATSDTKKKQLKENEKAKKKLKKGQVAPDDKVSILEEEKRFEKARKQLFMRANSVERMFRQFDINPYMLNDSELAELLYASYNKERVVHQSLNGKDPSDYTTLRVKAGRRVGR